MMRGNVGEKLALRSILGYAGLVPPLPVFTIKTPLSVSILPLYSCKIRYSMAEVWLFLCVKAAKEHWVLWLG